MRDAFFFRQNSHKNIDPKEPFRNLFIVKQFFPFSTIENVGRICSISAISLVRSLILPDKRTLLWGRGEGLGGECGFRQVPELRLVIEPMGRIASLPCRNSEGFVTPFFFKVPSVGFVLLGRFPSFPERAFQVREKVLAAANWGSGNYLIVKENYIAEQINPHVNIVFCPFW